MPATRFTPEQRVEIVLSALDGRRSAAEICREHQITTVTLYRWKEQFLAGALEAMKGRTPGRENRGPRARDPTHAGARRRIGFGELRHEKGAHSVNKKSRGAGFRWLVDCCKMSVRRAAFLCGLPRTSTYYKPRARLPPPVDRVVRQAVLEVAAERPSFGYRRVTAMVRRKLMFAVNTKAIRRIMRQENLLLKQPKRPPRQRLPKEPGTLTVGRPDEVWHMDAIYVWCGQDRWVLGHNIVDACTSEWVGFLFDRRYRKEECIKLLEQTVQERWPQSGRAPGTRLRMDNHFSQTNDDFVDAAKRLGFQPEWIHKHQPEMNGVVESFHSILRRDYLDPVDLESENHGREFLNAARWDYNRVKPKQRLGWKTPREYYEEKVTPNVTTSNPEKCPT